MSSRSAAFSVDRVLYRAEVYRTRRARPAAKSIAGGVKGAARWTRLGRCRAAGQAGKARSKVDHGRRERCSALDAPWREQGIRAAYRKQDQTQNSTGRGGQCPADKIRSKVDRGAAQCVSAPDAPWRLRGVRASRQKQDQTQNSTGRGGQGPADKIRSKVDRGRCKRCSAPDAPSRERGR